MSEQTWVAVEDYLNAKVVRPDEALAASLEATAAAGMPAIAVSAPQGKLLYLVARMIGAERILEIGTLGGYSTIWMARALPPDGRLVTIEIEPKHAEVAAANLRNAGLDELVDIRVGAALDLLPALDGESAGRFDLAFIDADKANIPEYFGWARRLVRPGGVVIVDNVVRSGAVLDESGDDVNVKGVRRLNDRLSSEEGVSATTIQTVGSKGYDGFTLALIE